MLYKFILSAHACVEMTLEHIKGQH